MATPAQRKHRAKRPEANCAVCERASALRCSRCKAVRYCSGRCQIIDWRMRHKQECHLPNANSSSSSPEMTHDSNLANISKSHDSENNNVCDAFKSKVESLHKIFDEMESSLATHKYEANPAKTSQKEDARTSMSHQSMMRDWSSKMIAALQAKLDYVMAERDALRSEVELLKSELSVSAVPHQWDTEEEVNSDMEMNNSYGSSYLSTFDISGAESRNGAWAVLFDRLSLDLGSRHTTLLDGFHERELNSM